MVQVVVGVGVHLSLRKFFGEVLEHPNRLLSIRLRLVPELLL